MLYHFLSTTVRCQENYLLSKTTCSLLTLHALDLTFALISCICSTGKGLNWMDIYRSCGCIFQTQDGSFQEVFRTIDMKSMALNFLACFLKLGSFCVKLSCKPANRTTCQPCQPNLTSLRTRTSFRIGIIFSRSWQFIQSIAMIPYIYFDINASNVTKGARELPSHGFEILTAKCQHSCYTYIKIRSMMLILRFNGSMSFIAIIAKGAHN